MKRTLEQALQHAISKGLINADNKHYEAPLQMSILEARGFLMELQALQVALKPLADMGEETIAWQFSPAHCMAVLGARQITVQQCRDAATLLSAQR